MTAELGVNAEQADLAVGRRSEALPQVEGVFLTQAAAGRAVDDSSSVLVTLQQTP